MLLERNLSKRHSGPCDLSFLMARTRSMWTKKHSRMSKLDLWARCFTGVSPYGNLGIASAARIRSASNQLESFCTNYRTCHISEALLFLELLIPPDGIRGLESDCLLRKRHESSPGIILVLCAHAFPASYILPSFLERRLLFAVQARARYAHLNSWYQAFVSQSAPFLVVFGGELGVRQRWCASVCLLSARVVLLLDLGGSTTVQNGDFRHFE